jgi:hypothetical protein
MTKAIYFDLDGTIANLYGVDGWLDCIINEYTKPYREAKALVNMRQLGRELNRLKQNGYTIGIISWLAKGATVEYNRRVAQTKHNWLAKHLSAVQFDEVHIVEYGTPKHTLGNDILFDDEEPNRANWIGKAYDVNDIIETLKAIV